jgi:hypothetical protein
MNHLITSIRTALARTFAASPSATVPVKAIVGVKIWTDVEVDPSIVDDDIACMEAVENLFSAGDFHGADWPKMQAEGWELHYIDG